MDDVGALRARLDHARQPAREPRWPTRDVPQPPAWRYRTSHQYWRAVTSMLSFVELGDGPWPQRGHQPEGKGEKSSQREHGECNARAEDEPPRGVPAPGTPTGPGQRTETRPPRRSRSGRRRRPWPRTGGRCAGLRLRPRSGTTAHRHTRRQGLREVSEPATKKSVDDRIRGRARTLRGPEPFRPPSMIVLEPVEATLSGVARPSQQSGSRNGSFRLGFGEPDRPERCRDITRRLLRRSAYASGGTARLSGRPGPALH